MAADTSALAESLLAEDFDLCEVYERMQPLVAADVFKSLGAALELCPLHFCDLAICEDDGVHGDEVYS